MLDGMPERRSSIKTSMPTARKRELATPLRRSPRIHGRNPQDLNSENPKPGKIHIKCSRKPRRELKKSDERSLISEIRVLGSRRSAKLSTRVDGVSNLRRSSRLSSLGNNNGRDGSKKSSDVMAKKFKHSVSVKSKYNMGILRKKAKWKKDMDSCDEGAHRVQRRNQCSLNVSVVVGLEAVNRRDVCVERAQITARRNQCCVNVSVVTGLEAVNKRDVCEKSQETRVIRKRKRGEEANKETVNGWTKKQEMALKRAYILAKPTPNFWKRVSKLVPGKSAKDCFDKIHSDQITPQPLPRRRVKKINSSPLGCFSLSASKLLGSSSAKVKRVGCEKLKSRVAKKTVRQLLQKHNRVDLNYEADLFSILEPNVNSSTQDSEPNNVVSTPKHLQGKSGFLQKCYDRSLSSQKKTLSRFSNSNSADLSSPPVLKHVKNRALHEKYIDQLHCREAKRKAACAQAGKENNSLANVPKTDVVRTAKNALVSDAIDAIKKLQHLQTNPKGDSSDCDDDDIDIDDVESDDLLTTSSKNDL